MPKIKIKPSPTKARILRALDENPGLFLQWNLRGNAWWSGTNDVKIKSELGNPRYSTMRGLNAELWIERVAEIYWSISEAGEAAIESLTTDDFTSPPPDITAREIIAILRESVFPTDAWMMVTELSIGDHSGFSRVDAYALKVGSDAMISTFPSKRTKGITGARQLTSWALEIKVSRSDFLSDIADIRKQDRAREICNRFAYVAPVGLIQKEELPAGCGLLEIHKSASKYRVQMTVEPDYEIAEPASWSLVAAIARAMMK